MMRTLTAAVAVLALGAAAAQACSDRSASSASLKVADSTPPASGTDTTAYPNSPNGSPATGESGQPVTTDHAACGTVKTAGCEASPPPSGKADTSDTSTSKTSVVK